LTVYLWRARVKVSGYMSRVSGEPGRKCGLYDRARVHAAVKALRHGGMKEMRRRKKLEAMTLDSLITQTLKALPPGLVPEGSPRDAATLGRALLALDRAS
jgi:hypothetical protein